MDWDAVAKIAGIVGGAGVFGAIGAWVSHFFASGNTRLEDRRKDKDAQQLRIDNLEGHTRVLNRNIYMAAYVRNLQVAELNRLTWVYDRMREVLMAMTSIVEEREPEQDYLIAQAKSFPESKVILDEAESIYRENNPIENGNGHSPEPKP